MIDSEHLEVLFAWYRKSLECEKDAKYLWDKYIAGRKPEELDPEVIGIRDSIIRWKSKQMYVRELLESHGYFVM
jgi:hypothetical protein